MSKHIKLTTGVDVPASAEHFRRDLQAVLASADADPLKVKIAIDENSIASAMQQLKKFAESTNMLSFGSGKGSGTKAATTEVVSSLENIDTKAQGVAQNVGTSFNTMTNNITTSIASASASIDTLISEMFQKVQSLKLPSADIQQVPLLPEYGSIPSYMQNIDLYPVIDQSNKLSISMLKAVESYEKFLALPAPSISLIDGLGIEDFTREALQAYNVIEVLIKAMQQKIPTGILEEIPGVTFVDIADGAQQATLAIEQTSQSLRDMGGGTESVNNASQSINKMGSEAASTQYKVENLSRAVQGFDNKWFSKDGLEFNDDDSGAKLARYVQRLEEYQERIKNISFSYENGKMVAKRGDAYLEQKEIDELISRYNELNTLRRVGVRNQNTSNKSAASIEREREALQNLNVELSRYIAENKGLMTSRQLDAFSKLYNSTKAGTIGLKEAKDAFARLKQEVNDSAGVVQKFFNQFKTSIISRLSTGAITAGFAALRKAVHEVYENIIQLDKAITDLQIATGGSRQQTAELVKEYSKLGNELGATTVEVAQAADEWLRQGYSAQESEELIRQSMILSKLGQIESSEATVALTSAINGYGKSVGDAAGIVDMLTAVDMEAAASAGGLAIAMSRTATGAKTAGVEMSTLIGWIAKVKEVTQDSDEAVGTFFKTMVARMGNIKSGYLFDPETDEDLSDVESVLSGVGIKLRDSKAEFRDLQDVLDEVGREWNTYSSVQQRAIAKAFGGTRQQEKFLVLMENYKDAMRLAEVATDSSGTAMRKYNDAYLKSYEAAKNSLQASKESFSQSLVNTDWVIGAVNALNTLVQVLTKLNETVAVGPLAGVGAVLAVVATRAHSLSQAFSSVQATLAPVISTLTPAMHTTEQFGEAVDQIVSALSGENKIIQQNMVQLIAKKDADAAIAVATRLNAAAEEEYTAAVVRSVGTQGAQILGLNKIQAEHVESVVAKNADAIASGKLAESDLKAQLISTGLISEKQAEQLTHLLCAGAKEAEKVATDKLTVSQKLLAAAGGPVGIAIAAITAAAVVLIKVFKHLSEAEDRAREDLAEMRSELDSTQNEIQSITSELEQNKTRLEELNKIEHPTYADQAEIAKLEETNQKLETQLALLRAREKYQKGRISEDEEEVWKRANTTKIGSTKWRNDGGGQYKWYKPEKFIDREVDENGNVHFYNKPLSTVEAVDVYIEKYNQAQKALEDYQKKALRNGEISDNEQEKINSLSAEVDRYAGHLLDMSDILADAGDSGQKFVDKIAYATTDAAGRWGMMKESLANTRIGDNIINGLSSENIDDRLGEDKIKEYAASIKNAGKESQLFNDITKGMSDKELILWFAELRGAAQEYEDRTKDATQATSDFKNMLSSLDSAQSGLKSISKAMQDISDKGKVSFSTISDITKALSEAGVDAGDIEKYSKALLTANGNSAKFQQTLTDLTYAYVKAKVGADKLTEANEDYIARMLEEVGVTNSAAVAHSMVSKNITISAQEYTNLNDKVKANTGALESAIPAIKNADGTYTILEDTLKNCGVAADAAAMMIAAANAEISASTITEITKAVEAYGALYSILADLGGTVVYNPDTGKNEYYPEGSFNSVQYVTDANGNKVPIDQAIENAQKYQKYLQELERIKKSGGGGTTPIYGSSSGGGSSGGGSSSGGGGGSGSSTSALDNYTKSVDNKQKKLELSYKRGEMSAKDYFKALEIIYKDGYDGLKKAIENGEFSDSDEDELLDAETGMLDKLQGAHRSSYEEEKKMQDHYLKMNYITEEQYFAELTRLYLTYYAGREEYSEEAQQAEEELYEKGTAIVEKWANAAVDAVNAVSSAMQSMASAATDLLQGLIDANEHSFDRYYKNLQHQLKMNYITEAEYNDKLDKLYKRYFKDRYIYLDQYQQYEEEVYQAEQQALQDAASATEDIHGKVVDMIRDELEEQKDAIDETKDAYLELIDIRRQALNEQKEQEDYEKEHAEKLAAVAELQRQLNALANDTSAEGVRKYKETLNSLHDAQEDLYDFEREHAYDSLEKQLDDQEAALEESASARSEQIDKLLEDNEWLVSEAWRRLIGMPEETYQQLIEHSKKYSTSIKDDITEAWNTAYEAMKRYYDGVNTEAGYAHITGRIGEKGMTDEEALQDDVTAGIKNVAEYTNVFVKAIAAFASAGASLVSSFASILNTVFPNPLTSLLATGAGGMASAVSGFGSVATGLTGFFGGLASGSNSVPATGIYRTDEFGEELKMFRTADGNYTMLTKGSKVFTARATERLAKVLEHPELLTGGLTQDVISNIAKAATPASSTVDASTQNITLQQGPFNISGANPDEIADKIKGTVANYTIDIMRKNARDKGRTRPVKTVY